MGPIGSSFTAPLTHVRRAWQYTHPKPPGEQDFRAQFLKSFGALTRQRPVSTCGMLRIPVPWSATVQIYLTASPSRRLVAGLGVIPPWSGGMGAPQVGASKHLLQIIYLAHCLGAFWLALKKARILGTKTEIISMLKNARLIGAGAES